MKQGSINSFEFTAGPGQTSQLRDAFSPRWDRRQRQNQFPKFYIRPAKELCHHSTETFLATRLSFISLFLFRNFIDLYPVYFLVQNDATIEYANANILSRRFVFRSRISEQIRFPQSYYDTTPSCKDYCITSRIFLFISRESRVSHDNKFSLTTASRSLTGCQGYNNTKKAELLDGKIDAKRSRVLSVGRERASLQDSRVKIVARLSRCWKS